MRLGDLAPELADIEALANTRRQHVHRLADDLQGGERIEFIRQHGLMTFSQFRDAVNNFGPWLRQSLKEYQVIGAPNTHELHAFLRRGYLDERHTPDLAGWIYYLCDLCPPFWKRIAAIEKPAAFPEPVRQMHTLITAASGWGKSELMKALVHHYVEHPTAAVVVLDPHGDMAGQIARFPEFRHSDRLVYIEPGLRPGMTVGLNPLDGRGLDEDGVSLFAAQVATCLGEIVSDLTPNMQTVARNCVRILLEEGNATLFDLVKLLAPRRRKKGESEPDDPRRMALVAKGRRHPDMTVAEFFKVDIDGESLDSAKAALRNRILSLLSIPSFQAMTCGPATVHLSTLLEQRKVVLVNLGPLGSEGGAAMGRLLVSLVAAIGRRREGTPHDRRVPSHVFVDEASTMVSPAMGRILAELRKYGIHLTLAQQVGGVGFDEDGRKVLATNTACKFVGSNSKADLKAVFGDSSTKDAEKLVRGQFWVRWGQDGEPVRLQVRKDLANGQHTMTDDEWQDVTADLVASGLYRPTKAPAVAAAAVTTANDDMPRTDAAPAGLPALRPGLALPLE